MRIAFVCNAFPNLEPKGPIFPALLELTTALKQAGHEVLVLTFNEEPNTKDSLRGYQINGIRVVQIQQEEAKYSTFKAVPSLPITAHYLARARAVAKTCSDLLAEFKPDVIECQDYFGMGFFLVAKRQYPVVVRCYGPLGTLMKAGLAGSHRLADIEAMNTIELSTIGAADGVIAICDDLARSLSSLCQRDINDFAIVRAPLSVPDLSKAQPVKASSNDCPRLFFWGNIVPLKGVDVLVEAFAKILSEFPECKLTLGGHHFSLSGDEGPYVNVLRQKIEELGLADKVELPGPLSRTEIISSVQKADVCVFPSRYETACYTCLEALSYGAAVVGSRVGGMKEYCIDGEHGLLVEPGNVDELAAKISQLLRDPELRRKLAAQGKERVRNFCSASRCAEESVAVYEKARERFCAERPHGIGFSLLASQLGRVLDTVPAMFLPEFMFGQKQYSQLDIDAVKAEVDKAHAFNRQVTEYCGEIMKRGERLGEQLESANQKCQELNRELEQWRHNHEHLSVQREKDRIELLRLHNERQRSLVSCAVSLTKSLDSLPLLKTMLQPLVKATRKLGSTSRISQDSCARAKANSFPFDENSIEPV